MFSLFCFVFFGLFCSLLLFGLYWLYKEVKEERNERLAKVKAEAAEADMANEARDRVLDALKKVRAILATKVFKGDPSFFVLHSLFQTYKNGAWFPHQWFIREAIDDAIEFQLPLHISPGLSFDETVEEVGETLHGLSRGNYDLSSDDMREKLQIAHLELFLSALTYFLEEERLK